MSRETKIKIDIETSQTESSLKALREEYKKMVLNATENL